MHAFIHSTDKPLPQGFSGRRILSGLQLSRAGFRGGEGIDLGLGHRGWDSGDLVDEDKGQGK